MTDEERADEYAKRKGLSLFMAGNSAQEIARVAYLDGTRDERKRLAEEGVCWQGDMDATIAQNLELKKQIEQLKDDINELKSHCNAVDDVNAKMRHCINCRHSLGRNIPLCITCTRGGVYYYGKKTDKWELMEQLYERHLQKKTYFS